MSNHLCKPQQYLLVILAERFITKGEVLRGRIDYLLKAQTGADLLKALIPSLQIMGFKALTQRRYWMSAKEQGITVTSVIVEALTQKFGEL